MHIPSYHKKPGWQRFLVGVFFGALISYWVVIFMYGDMYERLLKENSEIQNQLKDAENKIIALEQDKEDLNEKSKQNVTVEEVDLEILNAKTLKIDTLLQHQLESLVKEEIKAIIGRDLLSISDSDSLLISSIENKAFKVDDFSYSFTIKRIIIAPRVRIIVQAKISN
ncbi:sporulation membrane protein YtrI [Ornithinibacillus halotolerans]|uniref:Sporulation membrane protein YtrI n=1 Tax=Ornithinibacillus halotolerans TaxID=1274357 RepID=A0A916S3C9_9BACI|nr:sporulation membrane protein YtrI [Ornithinibacillus halotolerans]GGA82005.1 sporulation membrane protein YtrI [Ornithinibacillus halotolerans]